MSAAGERRAMRRAESSPPSLDDIGGCLGHVRTARAEAELWFAQVGHHTEDLVRFSRDLLSPEERGRVGRYRRRDAAERYVITRALVRLVLARALQQPTGAVEVTRTDSGKPVVAGGVHFNVSHSGELILLAWSRQCDVGVDVERRRRVPRVEDLSRRWLTTAERTDVSRMSDAGRDASEAFLRVWTRKEARLKALGVGISGAAMTLDTLDVHPLDDLLARFDEAPAHGYVGAIAFA